jgi:hypothetical protein
MRSQLLGRRRTGRDGCQGGCPERGGGRRQGSGEQNLAGDRKLARGESEIRWRTSRLERHRAANEYAISSGWEALVSPENE